jgi:hypothetical protein
MDSEAQTSAGDGCDWKSKVRNCPNLHVGASHGVLAQA